MVDFFDFEKESLFMAHSEIKQKQLNFVFPQEELRFRETSGYVN